MRLFLPLLLFLCLAVCASGCGLKAPADADLPPGVKKNPTPPNPETIQKRKLKQIEPRKAAVPAPSVEQR